MGDFSIKKNINDLLPNEMDQFRLIRLVTDIYNAIDSGTVNSVDGNPMLYIFGGTDTGSADAWVVTPSSPIPIQKGLTVLFVVGSSNTSSGGSATFKYNGGSAISVYQMNNISNNANPVNGQLYAGALAALTYDGTDWRIAFPSALYFDTSIGSSYGGGAGLPTSQSSFNTGFGVHSLNSITTGTRNTGFGLDTLEGVTTGINNTAMGTGSLEGIVAGSNNTAFGDQCHYLGNSSQDTAVGQQCMGSTNTGTQNSAFGCQAMAASNSGTGNCAFGYSALIVVSSGNYNTAVGYQAMPAETNGQYNVAMGLQAAQSQNGGTGNTAIGTQALNSNVTGNYNIGLGFKAGNYETGSNALYIDNQDRGNLAGGKTGALIYGTFNATPTSQTLNVNATLLINSLLTTVNGSVGGTIVWSMPEQGASYKKVIIQFNSFHDAGTSITFPTSFSSTPIISANNSGLTISTISASSITIPVSASATGWIIIEGF